MSLTDDVDGWISQLMGCKPLSENEVKKLCEKVSCRDLLLWVMMTWERWWSGGGRD